MTIINAIILGIIQGLTEFLPISSSGHLALTQHILGLSNNNLFFDVMLHLGTLTAIFVVYYKLVFRLIKAFFTLIGKIFTLKINWSKFSKDERMVVTVIIGLLPLCLLFVPIPGLNENLKDIIDSLHDSRYIMIIVGCSLLITSLLLAIGIHVNKKNKHHTNNASLSYNTDKTEVGRSDGLLIGFMQFIAAILPGLSRSGSTLSVGLMRKVNKQTALDYSFILGMPAMLAAAVVQIKDIGNIQNAGLTPSVIMIGIVVSALVGIFAIVLFKWLLSTNKMSIFIIYTLIIGLIALGVGIYEIFCNTNVFTGIML